MHDNSLAEHISLIPEKGNGLIYSDFSDGEVFRSQSFPPEGHIEYILYQDAFEVVNPLGAARGKFKVLAVYLTLENIAPHLRSELNLQQLVLLCLEKDFRHFGCCKVFERLLSDLSTLTMYVFNYMESSVRHLLPLLQATTLTVTALEGLLKTFQALPIFAGIAS